MFPRAPISEKAFTDSSAPKREFSYMLVHGFYHLMGYDHIEEQDKKIMRPKEDKILESLKILYIIPTLILKAILPQEEEQILIIMMIS